MWDFFVNYARKATVSALTTGILAAGAAYGTGIGEACAAQVGNLVATAGSALVMGTVAFISTYFPKNQNTAVPAKPRKP